MASMFFSIVTLIAAIVSAAPQGPSARGWPTNVNRWPSIAQVEIRNPPGSWTHSCSATILRSNYVLSAAQCFSGYLFNPRNRRIRAGTAHSHYGGSLHYVARVYIHPLYRHHGMDGDITVVRLTEPLIYGPTIQQGRFITHGIKVPDNLPVRTVGWNFIWDSHFFSTLLETEVITVNNGVCAEGYLASSKPLPVTENMICADAINNNNSFCQGDPGSPLYFDDPIQGDIIMGIFSFNKGCPINNLPSVYTAVSPYINWAIDTAV
ncbi:unnamed protein product [Arctia plantaginis]|uniref:Peptidase S1 domain-containing protein n=1 Tax=Arctia plantaginis TaxID=874455 RepID=A0A8S0ZYI0_ARCPL|nr:unnamed protein product [Arctia plantaginis]CAB3238074.1 unnamed protein product [Arctia plantaginis]